MIQIHQAREGELAAAGALWADTFGDGPDVQRDFYRLCGPGGPLVLTEDGQLRAMLALPQVYLSFGAEAPVRAGYVYALACAPARRGEGWASMLVETAAGLARNRGFECLLTVPAEPELFGFFAKNGFQPGFFLRETAAQPAPPRRRRCPRRSTPPCGRGCWRAAPTRSTTPDSLPFSGGCAPTPAAGCTAWSWPTAPAAPPWRTGPAVRW